MKKQLCLVTALLLAVALLFSACAGSETQAGSSDPASTSASDDGSTESPETTTDFPDEPDVAQMPNPMAPADSPAAFAPLGIAIDAPDGAENTSYYVISGQIAEVNFQKDGKGYSLRASKVDGDIAGLYGPEESETLPDGAVLTVIRAGAGEWLRLTWDKDDIHYALTNTDGADRDALLAVYDAVK